MDGMDRVVASSGTDGMDRVVASSGTDGSYGTDMTDGPSASSGGDGADGVVKVPERGGKKRSGYTRNKGNGTPKRKRTMAKESRRINRK